MIGRGPVRIWGGCGNADFTSVTRFVSVQPIGRVVLIFGGLWPPTAGARFRMQNHHILMPTTANTIDMGVTGKMTMGRPGDGKNRMTIAHSRTGVSLFRPGQAVEHPPLPEDQRTGYDIFAIPQALIPPSPLRVWESIGPIALDADRLAGNGLFTQASTNPAVTVFDMLRTRLLQALRERNWQRIAVTSPTHGCGKSFVAANLALSLARLPATRTILMDLELRRPHLAGIFGVADAAPLQEFLSGEQPLESHFRRFGKTLALALNGAAVADAAAVLQDPDTAQALDAMISQLQPDAVIYDLPPVLTSDDVMAMIPQIDAVLLVADGTRTTADEIKATERMLDGRVPLMGVVLNRAQDRKRGRYTYGKG
jgi:protein-tyrosine kinase